MNAIAVVIAIYAIASLLHKPLELARKDEGNETLRMVLFVLLVSVSLIASLLLVLTVFSYRS